MAEIFFTTRGLVKFMGGNGKETLYDPRETIENMWQFVLVGRII